LALRFRRTPWCLPEVSSYLTFLPGLFLFLLVASERRLVQSSSDHEIYRSRFFFLLLEKGGKAPISCCLLERSLSPFPSRLGCSSNTAARFPCTHQNHRRTYPPLGRSSFKVPLLLTSASPPIYSAAVLYPSVLDHRRVRPALFALEGDGTVCFPVISLF